jgi:GT2 family glycosyltransferase
MISFITVAYNCSEHIVSLYESIKKNVRDIDWELVVVDNSEKNSLNFISTYSNVKYIYPNDNLGFGKACNLGSQNSKFDIFYFINPDSRLISLSNDFISTFDMECIGIPFICEGDRKSGFNSYSMRFPILKLFFLSDVRWYKGSGLIVSRKTFKSIGGWSTEFFMYSEDVDFFYKAYIYNIKIFPCLVFQEHDGGGATKKTWNEFNRQKIMTNSMKIFYYKWGFKFDYFFTFPILMTIGMVASLFNNWQPIIAYILNNFKKKDTNENVKN